MLMRMTRYDACHHPLVVLPYKNVQCLDMPDAAGGVAGGSRPLTPPIKAWCAK